MFSSVRIVREVPNNVVKARPEMVDDFAREHAEARRKRSLHVILDCLRNNLHIVMAEERVFALLEKPSDLNLKIADVLVGPI
jgi:hypothetical protein